MMVAVLAPTNTCREGMAATIPPRSCALPTWHGHAGTSRRQTQRGARLAAASRAAPALRRCRAWWAIQLHTQLSYTLAPLPHISAFLSLVILPDGCPASSDALPFPAGLKPGGLLGPSPSKGRAQGMAHCKTEGGWLRQSEEGADLHPCHLHAASFQQS